MFSGECECRLGFIPWESKEGPCPENEQLENVDDKSVCKPSECPDKQIRWNNGACLDPIDCLDEDYQVQHNEISRQFDLSLYHNVNRYP